MRRPASKEIDESARFLSLGIGGPGDNVGNQPAPTQLGGTNAG